jgi:GT2 family glycosyltransferase/glycosyltransferase involved in cell wall biosynthesis
MRVLLITHGYPPAAAGGTEVYTRELARTLANGDGADRDEVVVLTRDADPCRPEYSVRRRADGHVAVVGINNTFQACRSYEDSYSNPDLLEIALEETAAAAPDVVHVQHLTCLSTGLPAGIAALNVPVVMTLNDYWMICHRGQLFDLNRERCDGPFDGGCSACLPPGILANPIAIRAGRRARASSIPGLGLVAHHTMKAVERLTPAASTRAATGLRLQHLQAAAAHVDLFLAPSATLEAWFLRFGVPPVRLRRCTQGINLAPFRQLTRQPSSLLRIGYAGGIIPSKAPHLLLEAVSALDPSSFVVDVLGESSLFHGDDSYSREVALLLTRPFVRRIGAVPHERMPDALAAIDILVVPSVWIENAPFIIREAFAAGVPVVAANLGGMAEMVRHDIDGLLFDAGNAAALRAALGRIIGEPGLLDRLRAGIRQPTSMEEDARGLRQIYQSVARKTRAPRAVTMAARSSIGAVVLNYRTPEQTWLAARALQTSTIVPNPIVIVDNGSADGSVEWLGKALEEVQVVATGSNLGFSGGCNAGLRQIVDAGLEFVLLVNSDVVVRPDAIDALLTAARQYPDAGVLAPVLLSREEPDRIASAGISFHEVSGRMRHRAAGLPLSLLQPSAAHEVDAVSGAVMLIRTGVLHRIGELEEKFFFSFEDLDFCWRARRAKFGILCVPDAIAYHEGGRTIGRRSPRRVYFATRNHLYLVARTAPRTAVTRLARAGLIVGLNAAYALVSRDVPLFGGLAAVARGTWHHARGRYGSD